MPTVVYSDGAAVAYVTYASSTQTWSSATSVSLPSGIERFDASPPLSLARLKVGTSPLAPFLAVVSEKEVWVGPLQTFAGASSVASVSDASSSFVSLSANQNNTMLVLAAAKAAEQTVAVLVSTDGAGFAPTDQGIYPGTGLEGLALGSFPSGLLILALTTAEWQMGWYYGLC